MEKNVVFFKSMFNDEKEKKKYYIFMSLVEFENRKCFKLST